MIIGGQERHLGAWRPSGRRVTAIKPSIEIVALPMRHAIDAVPLDRDQGQLGSCGPNSLDELYASKLLGHWSRLFAYYFTRATEGDTADDDGVTIPDLLDVAATMGLPPELVWPYDVARYRDVPPTISLVAALPNRVLVQDPVVDLDHLLFELANDQPVILGFGVPSSMASDATAKTGVVAVPSATDPSVGGHCVLARGYDRGRGLVQTTCHYGSGFGDHGAIWLPFAHWTAGNVSDMRAVRKIGAA